MKKNILLVAAIMMSLTGFAQFPGGGFGGGMPQGGFGGPQGGAQVETSEKFTDINYAGDDGQVYHNLDIYLPKEVKDKYPVVVHVYGSAWGSNNGKGGADLGTIGAALLNAGYALP